MSGTFGAKGMVIRDAAHGEATHIVVHQNPFVYCSHPSIVDLSPHRAAA